MTALPAITNVVVDLDADAITGLLTGDPCGLLVDRVQARHATQTAAASKPIYTASNPDFGGHATLTFDGIDDFLDQTAALSPPLTRRTVIFIGQVLSTGNVVWLDGTTATTDTQLYYSSAAPTSTSSFGGTSRTDFGARLTTPQVIIAQQGGTNVVVSASQNGGTAGTATSDSGYEYYDMLRVAAAHDLGTKAQVVVTRVVICDGHMGASDRTLLSSWVQDTYGITVADYAGSGGTNVAPTAPGAFTSPAASASVSGIGLVQWGASTDANGDEIAYDVELATNGATYVRKRTGLAGTFFDYDYSAETLTATAKWRVRASDGALTSAWTESGTFTIAAPEVEPALTVMLRCHDGVRRPATFTYLG